MDNSHALARITVGVLLAALSGSCRSEHPTGPGPTRSGLAAGFCADSCTLVETAAPLRAASFRADSADAVINLAVVAVTGSPGDSLVLHVQADGPVLSAIATSIHVVVRVNGEQSRYPMSALVSGATVFRFVRPESVRITYDLTREMRGSVPDGDFRVWQTSGGAVTTALLNPWVRSPMLRATLSPASCMITEQSGLVCGDTVNLSSFAVPQNIGGTFTSQAGTGASSPITITFSHSVRLMTVKIYDPTFAGNQMVLFDSAGNQLGSVSFNYSGQPGLNTPDEQTLIRRGIRRVSLIPAGGDYVAYDASFEFDTCASTGDSILDNPQVENSLLNSLALSGPDAAPGSGQKKERGGYIWRMPDGSIQAIEITDTTFMSSTECTFTFKGLQVPEPGAVRVAIFHTHPSSNGEPIYQCGPPYKEVVGGKGVMGYAAPDLNGGGSDSDWAATDKAGIPGYVINKDGRVWKLTPGTPKSQRQFNSHRWAWKATTVPGCFNSLP